MNLKIVNYEDYLTLSKKVELLEAKLSEVLHKAQHEKQKEFLTVKEFLEETGISRTTFEKMRREQHPEKFRLEAIKRGGKLYIPQEEKNRFFTFG
jgi:hypothetical protein